MRFPKYRRAVRVVRIGAAIVALALLSAGSLVNGAQAPGAAWRMLFDGKTLNGWRGYRSEDVKAWRAENGMLTKNAITGNLVTTDQFGDFELEFEWRIARGGNAGVFIRATEEYSKIYWTATEYQLLDDANGPDGRNPLTSAGAAYGLYPVRRGVVKAADEWNTSRILARGAHVEHWLNGQKVVEYEAWSPDWEARVQASKFKDYPNDGRYGRAQRGHVGIQGDHAGALALRNIRIRELS